MSSRSTWRASAVSRVYVVRRLKIGRTEQMDALARAAGTLYSQVVVWFWRTVRHKDLWLKAKHLMRWLTSALLHAHSSDAVVQSFFAALAAWRERRKSDPGAKPPRRRNHSAVSVLRSPRSKTRWPGAWRPLNNSPSAFFLSFLSSLASRYSSASRTAGLQVSCIERSASERACCRFFSRCSW